MSKWSLRQKLRESIIDAVGRGDRLQVETLLNKGANVNETEGGYLSRRSLLILAVEKDHVDVAGLLVDRGADLSATVMVNKREMTALDIARDKELESLAKFMEKKMEANQRLISAVQNGNSNMVQEALNTGANINVIHKDSDSLEVNLLFFALGEGFTDVASVLIRRGIDLHFTVAYPDQPQEETAQSYARRLHHDDLANLIDKEIVNQESKPEMNTINENSQLHGKAIKETGSKPSGELEDIEDADLEEEMPVESLKPQRATTGKTCIIS